MKFLRDKDVAIVGYAELKIQRRGGKLPLELAGEVFQKLIDSTGIDPALIDGLVSTMTQSYIAFPYWTNTVADSLGLSLRYAQVTDLGGVTTTANVARASAAIHSGLADIVLCLAADAPTSQNTQRMEGHQQEFMQPAGFAGPPQIFGLIMSAYEHRYGSTAAGLARLAVAQREGALRNPNAVDTLQHRITEQDYLDSRFIAEPIRLLDSVMRCDGASCLLMMSTKRAKELGFKKMAHPVAYSERINFDAQQAAPAEDIWRSGFSVAGPQALANAGMQPSDIKMFHPYDDFLIAVLLQLEQIGFCAEGQGNQFLLDHNLTHSGDLPINTSGGMISAGQGGFSGGGTVLTEAVRQIFGEADGRQVNGATNAMVTGIGSMQYARNWGGSSVLILEAA